MAFGGIRRRDSAECAFWCSPCRLVARGIGRRSKARCFRKESELRTLRRWVESSPASDLSEFARVRQLAERMLEDGRVSGSEEAEVLEAFDAIVDPAS